MLRDVAPLGFNPARYSTKPQKGNILMEFVDDVPQQQPQTVSSTKPPSWRAAESKGAGSMEAATNSYYASQVKPLVDRLLQQCFVTRPLDIAGFASAFFQRAGSRGTREGGGFQFEGRCVAKTVPWAKYEKQFVKPATAALLAPLVQCLTATRPADAAGYAVRVFRVLDDLASHVAGDSAKLATNPSVQLAVPVEQLVERLEGLLWNVNDEQLTTLNAAIVKLSERNQTVQLAELVMGVPLEIAELLSEAIELGADGDADEGDSHGKKSKKDKKKEKKSKKKAKKEKKKKKKDEKKKKRRNSNQEEDDQADEGDGSDSSSGDVDDSRRAAEQPYGLYEPEVGRVEMSTPGARSRSSRANREWQAAIR
eukprot:INCI6761.1.p1 GENE.INCI6761.1~~INCI6761.1.p1  ORF type:complete len:367 (-),score=78.66 INCI6761.1:1100-2200(-)